MDQNKIKKLVALSAKRRANPTDDRLRTEHMGIWKTMTGGEQSAAMKQIKAAEEKDKETPVATATATPPKAKPGVAAKKQEEVKEPLPVAPAADAMDPKPAKKEKATPPPIEYNFDAKHGDVGRRVFTAHGTAVVRAADTEKAVYKVTIEDEAETEKVLSMKSVRFKAFNEDFRDKYVTDKTVRTASGAYSVSNQDDVAKQMNGLTVEQLAEVAEKAGLSVRFAGWSAVNAGMKRMNLSNVFRGILKEGTKADEKQVAAVKGALAIASQMKRPEPPKKVMTDEQKAKLKAAKDAKAKPSAQEAVAAVDAEVAAKPPVVKKGKKEAVKV